MSFCVVELLGNCVRDTQSIYEVGLGVLEWKEHAAVEYVSKKMPFDIQSVARNRCLSVLHKTWSKRMKTV